MKKNTRTEPVDYAARDKQLHVLRGSIHAMARKYAPMMVNSVGPQGGERPDMDEAMLELKQQAVLDLCEMYERRNHDEWVDKQWSTIKNSMRDHVSKLMTGHGRFHSRGLWLGNPNYNLPYEIDIEGAALAEFSDECKEVLGMAEGELTPEEVTRRLKKARRATKPKLRSIKGGKPKTSSGRNPK